MEIVIQVISKQGVLVTYIKPKEKHNGFQLRHRTKFKEIIYGGIFTYYHKDMDFSKSNVLTNN
jgi:hypothetical protein